MYAYESNFTAMMQNLTSNPNRAHNPIFPPSIATMTRGRVRDILTPSETIDEFVNMVALRPLEPLTCLWIGLSQYYPFPINTDSMDLLREKIRYIDCGFIEQIIRGYILFVPDDADMHVRSSCGYKCMLWETTFVPTTDNINEYGFTPTVAKYTRSNEFIEHRATVAYLYLHMLCCRDIARMIARIVAKMYLDDYKWMANIQSDAQGAEKVRLRVLKELQTI